MCVSFCIFITALLTFKPKTSIITLNFIFIPFVIIGLALPLTNIFSSNKGKKQLTILIDLFFSSFLELSPQIRFLLLELSFGKEGLVKVLGGFYVYEGLFMVIFGALSGYLYDITQTCLSTFCLTLSYMIVYLMTWIIYAKVVSIKN